MSLPLKSQQDLYNLFQDTVQNANPELTDFLDGSILDGLAGVFSVGGTELQRYNTIQFSKTFFNLAQGPDENGGGPDDLQTLAVDHYGDAFERPGAVAAVDVATFSRPTATHGAVTILSGTVVKTKPDPNGNVQRYTIDSTVTLAASGSSSLNISVGITAVIKGAAGSASAGAINVIESSLSDSTITVTNAGNQTGEDAQDSPTYRETIRNLVEGDKGATIPSIEAIAKTIAGVKTATVVSTAVPVIQWNISNSTPIGSYFYIPYVNLYIADSSGSANQSLINEVSQAITSTRATGVAVPVKSAVAEPVNWLAAITLNPTGPNYAALQIDLSNIYNAMSTYINSLPVGTGFNRVLANAAILAIFGPSGTGDITVFSTVQPTADVAPPYAYSKLIAESVGST
jgi:hypothetical protein